MSNQMSLEGTGQENHVTLCHSCIREYPDCPNNDIVFGTDQGGDNICACSNYTPITTRAIFTHLPNGGI